MSFITDQQTLDDLNIFGKRGSDSVFQLFNQTNTRGGAAILKEMFIYPLSDCKRENKNQYQDCFKGISFSFLQLGFRCN